MHKFQKFQIIIHNTKNYLNENGDKFVLAEDMDYEKIKIDWNYLEMKVVPQLENAYKTKTPLKFFYFFLKRKNF
jgi:translation elongation factor P/translation initiation factor 5A